MGFYPDISQVYILAPMMGNAFQDYQWKPEAKIRTNVRFWECRSLSKVWEARTTRIRRGSATAIDFITAITCHNLSHYTITCSSMEEDNVSVKT